MRASRLVGFVVSRPPYSVFSCTDTIGYGGSRTRNLYDLSPIQQARREGIEPSSSVLETEVIPLYERRIGGRGRVCSYNATAYMPPALYFGVPAQY